MGTSLEVLKKCFSEAHFRQYQREGEIRSLFEATQPSIDLLFNDRTLVKKTVNADGSKMRLVSIGNMTDFPAEPQYPSIRLPDKRTLITDWMADATTLVFTDMNLAGLVATKILQDINDRKMLFICYQGGPIQQEEARINSTRQLFRLVDILTPSLQHLYLVIKNNKKEAEHSLKEGISLLPERLQKIAQPYYIPSIKTLRDRFGKETKIFDLKEIEI